MIFGVPLGRGCCFGPSSASLRLASASAGTVGGLGRYVELVSGVSWSRNCQTFAADFLTLLVGRSSLTRLRAAPISFC